MEKLKNRQEIYSGKVIHVVKDQVELDDGTLSYREVVKHNGGVCIALKDGDYYYLVRQFRYALNDELLEFRNTYKGNFSIQRYKGLGEMNADQLWETTMDPKQRNIIKVSINDTLLAEKRVNTLMGENVDIRKDWIEENVIFSLEDDFKK